MNYIGWVKCHRRILSDLYQGKLTLNEFAVLMILTLYADSKTGGYKINATALRTFSGTQLSEDSSQRVLKSLEDKGYIKRKPSTKHEVYPYLVHGYEVTVGDHKGKRVNVDKTVDIDKPHYELPSESEGAVESAGGGADDPAVEGAVESADDPAAGGAVGGADKTRSKNQEVRSENEELNELMNQSFVAIWKEDSNSNSKSDNEQEESESSYSVRVRTDEVIVHLDFLKHFSSCLGKKIPVAAEPVLRDLFEKSHLTEIQFAGFLLWALDENDFISRYHKVAADPVATFSKNFEKNLKRYKVETKFVREGRPSAEWKIDKKSVLRRFNLFCNLPFPADYVERLEDDETYRVLNWWAEVNARGEMYMYLNQPEPLPGEDGCIIITEPSNLVGPYPLMRKAFLELVSEEESEYDISLQLCAEVLPDSTPRPKASQPAVEPDEDVTPVPMDAPPVGTGAADRLAAYFFELLEQDQRYLKYIKGWPAILEFLLKETQLGEEVFKQYIHWALLENASANPQYSSVKYLHSANDPVDNFKKHSEGLLKQFKAHRKVRKITDGINTPDWLKRDKEMLTAILAEQRKGGMTADEVRAEMERTGLSMREVLDQHKAQYESGKGEVGN